MDPGRPQEYFDQSRPLADGAQGLDKTYNDPADRFWALYLTDADKKDQEMTENMKGDTDGILIFTGLFAATVAAFIIEFYKTLNPSSGDSAVTLLSGISSQITAVSNGTQAGPPSSPRSFHAPTSSVRISSLWFISLFLSVYVALASTLVQQWCRRYLRAARRRGPPHKRGPVHAVVAEGMKRFHIQHVVEIIIALLHLSVFLFLGGLCDFLFIVNASVAYAVIPFLAVGGLAYFGLTVVPFFFPSSPYDTPLTHLVRIFIACFSTARCAVSVLTQSVERLGASSIAAYTSSREPSDDFPDHEETVHNPAQLISRLYRTRKHVLEEIAATPSQEYMHHALYNSLKVLDEEWEIEEFLVGLPGFLDSVFVGHHRPDLVFNLIQHHALVPCASDLLLTYFPGRGHTLSSSSIPVAKQLRRIQAVLGTLRIILLHVPNMAPARLCTLAATDTDVRTTPTLVEIVSIASWISSAPGVDPSVAICAASALARLRKSVLDSVFALDAASSTPYLSQLLDSVCVDNFGRASARTSNLTDAHTHWTHPKMTPDGSRHADAAAGHRAGYLDVLDAYVRAIRHIHDHSSYIAQKDLDLGLQTMHALVDAFRDAYHGARETMGQDAVDQFAALWTDVSQSPNGGLTVELFAEMRQVAELVLPLATPIIASPSPVRTPLPDCTPSEVGRVERTSIARDGENEASAPNESCGRHGGGVRRTRRGHEHDVTRTLDVSVSLTEAEMYPPGTNGHAQAQSYGDGTNPRADDGTKHRYNSGTEDLLRTPGVRVSSARAG
ncbi:hypothetical protein OF83DRAFT_124607 [Amylostereum chailletii]|nr:hypothetical protein OF83DRAFT_124607 [Amylostereum chailletii]